MPRTEKGAHPMNTHELDPGLPLMQDADLDGKVVLVRVDHNVVKKGKIEDPFRIDAGFPTLYRIAEQGGRPILMTHVGRPRDKKTGKITGDGVKSVQPIARYLEEKLDARFVVPELEADGDLGIRDVGGPVAEHVKRLRERLITGIYLPNTRCFQGEEEKGEARERLARQLAGLADVYVNDAFGSWQPHASTFDVTRHLPSFAGLLMQKELSHLRRVLEPVRPFVAVVAGAKYDTKIGPLRSIYEKVDHLILGGVIYNAFLCARYGIEVRGVADEDVRAARELVEMDGERKKIVELPVVEESDVLDAREQGRFRPVRVSGLERGRKYGAFLDAVPESFDDPLVRGALSSAGTIFVNAVMGLAPHFYRGTERLNREVFRNHDARKLFGGGDTLQEFKNLNPGLYLSALMDPSCYFFTGGGTVLKAVEEGSPYALEPVKALMENRGRGPSS
jgi:phosphoglycerate kinase